MMRVENIRNFGILSRAGDSGPGIHLEIECFSQLLRALDGGKKHHRDPTAPESTNFPGHYSKGRIDRRLGGGIEHVET